jgi:hypothetical protein
VVRVPIARPAVGVHAVALRWVVPEDRHITRYADAIEALLVAVPAEQLAVAIRRICIVQLCAADTA